MHQSLGMEGHCRADGSKTHIWAHWEEVAQSIIQLLMNYLNFPWTHWNQPQRWIHIMAIQLDLDRPPGLGSNCSTWQELHMWLKHARWPKIHTILNTPTPLLPCKATEHQACSKHGTESPWMWVSDSKIEYSVKRSLLQFVWLSGLFYSVILTSLVHLNNISPGGLMTGGFSDQEPGLFIFTSLVWIQQRDW